MTIKGARNSTEPIRELDRRVVRVRERHLDEHGMHDDERREHAVEDREPSRRGSPLDSRERVRGTPQLFQACM